MAYGIPRFSELGKVLTKGALERSCMVLCSPDVGAHGGNEYWRTLLDNLMLTSVQLPDDAIYVALGRTTPIGKPDCQSMLSVVDGGLTPVPWEDLDRAMVQEIQRESDGYALSVLKDRLRPQDAVETTPGGDEYVVSDTTARSLQKIDFLQGRYSSGDCGAEFDCTVPDRSQLTVRQIASLAGRDKYSQVHHSILCHHAIILLLLKDRHWLV